MIRTKIRASAVQIGVAAGLLGGVTGLALVGPGPVSLFQPATHSAQVEDISGPCDEAENAKKPECVGSTTGPDTTIPGTTSTTVGGTTSTTMNDSTPPGPATSSFDAGGAGTVSYRVDGDTLTLISAVPAAGWNVEVERASGFELDLDFRSGTRRVQVDVEFEDGGVRERVRVRDDATNTRTETTNGTATDARGDNSGPGNGTREDSVDDRSDRDRDDDRAEDRDDDRSGHGGGDDDRDDDRSGRGGGDDDRDDDDDRSGRGGGDDD